MEIDRQLFFGTKSCPTPNCTRSYSERQIYQSAMERLAREVAAVKNISEIKATEQLETMLGKAAKANKAKAANDEKEAA